MKSKELTANMVDDKDGSAAANLMERARAAGCLRSAPDLLAENERLRAENKDLVPVNRQLATRLARVERLLRLAEIDLASFVRQDSTALLGDIRKELDGTRYSSGILRNAALAGGKGE